MFDRWAMGSLRYDTGDFGGGGGDSFEYLQDNYPWLLSLLEPHRFVCTPDDYVDVFGRRNNGDIYCDECDKVVANWKRDRKGNHKVGIFGFGNFGKLLTKHLTRAFHDVMVTDVVDVQSKQTPKIKARWGSRADVASREIVVLAVPFQNLEGLLQQISPNFQPGALVVDVCSVKQEPIKLMLKYLPKEVEILATHPLFGPQSAKDGLQGHKIVLCPVRVSKQRMGRVHNLLRHGYMLDPVIKEPTEHDREMAVVQGLTHFIARGLAGCGVKGSELATTAFDRLCEVAELLGNDSWELFGTIQNGNPFAAEMRRRFVKELQKLERRLQE